MRFFYSILLMVVTVKAHAFIIYEGTKIWDQDSIVFYFLDGSDQQQSEVKEFSKLWQRYTGIQFKFSTKKPPRFNLKKYYKITFKGNSNESTQGAINGIIHLGHLSDDIIFRKTTILHEFGHMLGLAHEHQRFDRPTSLNNSQLIDACMINQQQQKAWCEENLNNVSRRQEFIKSEYDEHSIMHYKLNNVAGNDSELLEKLPESNNNSLSYTDKYYIALLYNQNISEETLLKMHKQDLWNQEKFELAAQIKKENSILNLTSPSCMPLDQNNQTKDGKYCSSGFMVIGTDGFSFPVEAFDGCHNNYKLINELFETHPLCQLNDTNLSQMRQAWNEDFSQYGQCKLLEINQKNNQEYFCKEGYSFVTNSNNMIGNRTICFNSHESVYQAMKENEVCNMNDSDFRIYQKIQQNKLIKSLKTNTCQVVKKEYQSINCPEDFDYTIVNLENTDRPINNKCFANQYQAINAMREINICYKNQP
ncbi:MAG: M12 family metallopeptidase [Marinicellaceae bacterium]